LTVTETNAHPAADFQWFRNGVAVAGANGPVLELAEVTAEDSGDYEVVVSNFMGTVTHRVAAILAIGATWSSPPLPAIMPTER
jgi:hypothetical protein